MNTPWAIRLAVSDVESLAPLRRAPGIEVALDGEALWIRGPEPGPALARELLGLPATARFRWLPGDRLQPMGSRIPAGTFPDLGWLPLPDFLVPVPPATRAPAPRPSPAPLRLERCGRESPASLLMTSFDAWEAFADRAAEVRLAPLRFAATPRGEALIQGSPLPPIPGRRWVVRDGLAIPAGFTWRPAVGMSVLLRAFECSPERLVVWFEEGDFCRIRNEQFIPATRASIRATGARLAAAARHP